MGRNLSLIRRTSLTNSDVSFDFKKESQSQIGDGFDELLKPGAITIFGEIHGTREVPNLISDLVRSCPTNSTIVIGLEVPESLTPLIETFMLSGGSDTDMIELVAHQFWQAHDGRSSSALLQLFVDLRKLGIEGSSISIFAFDPESGRRDEGMAKIIVKKLESIEVDRTITLLVAGNLHARTDSRRWMGWHLRQAYPHTVSLNIAYSGGNAWICTAQGCRSTPLTGIDRGKKEFVERKETDSASWQGIFYLGTVSASSPVDLSL